MKHKMSKKTARRWLARNKFNIARNIVENGELVNNAISRRANLCREVLKK